MAVKVELSERIERPVGIVFRWYADDHVKNHPRWDPNIELSQDAPTPIGVGTIIRRRNRRSGTPVEGTMEVVEYQPGQSIGAVLHDGPTEMRSRATFASQGPELTTLTLWVDAPTLDRQLQGAMTDAVTRSLRRIKELIESET